MGGRHRVPRWFSSARRRLPRSLSLSSVVGSLRSPCRMSVRRRWIGARLGANRCCNRAHSTVLSQAPAFALRGRLLWSRTVRMCYQFPRVFAVTALGKVAEYMSCLWLLRPSGPLFTGPWCDCPGKGGIWSELVYPWRRHRVVMEWFYLSARGSKDREVVAGD